MYTIQIQYNVCDLARAQNQIRISDHVLKETERTKRINDTLAELNTINDLSITIKHWNV